MGGSWSVDEPARVMARKSDMKLVGALWGHEPTLGQNRVRRKTAYSCPSLDSPASCVIKCYNKSINKFRLRNSPVNGHGYNYARYDEDYDGLDRGRRGRLERGISAAITIRCIIVGDSYGFAC